MEKRKRGVRRLGRGRGRGRRRGARRGCGHRADFVRLSAHLTRPRLLILSKQGGGSRLDGRTDGQADDGAAVACVAMVRWGKQITLSLLTLFVRVTLLLLQDFSPSKCRPIFRLGRGRGGRRERRAGGEREKDMEKKRERERKREWERKGGEREGEGRKRERERGERRRGDGRERERGNNLVTPANETPLTLLRQEQNDFMQGPSQSAHPPPS